MSKRSRRGLVPAAVGVAGLGALVHAPAGRGHAAHQGLGGVGADRPAAEGPEVVRTQQHVRGGLHGAEVELVPHVPGQGSQERVGRGRIPDQVAVGPSGGRAAGVERVVDELGAAHHHLGSQLAVEGTGEPDPVVGNGREVDVDDLASGVHAGVGAAGAGDGRRLAQSGRPLDRLAQRAGDGRDLGLDGKAPEGCTVVRDQQPPALQGSAGGLLHP